MAEVTVKELDEDLHNLEERVQRLSDQINNIWAKLSDLENWASFLHTPDKFDYMMEEEEDDDSD